MISCKEFVEEKKKILKEEIKTFVSPPNLMVVQIGYNKASESYIRNKRKVCEEVGVHMSEVNIVDVDELSNEYMTNKVQQLNLNEHIDGIIIQLPIPDKFDIKSLQECISKEKDIDGFRRDSCFEPCTPKGIIDYLDYNQIDFSGKNVVVIGRSKIVGQPLANMLIERGATVTCCNSKTKDIKFFTRNADIVVSAIGKANFFDDSYFEYGQVIVDVGINRDKNGKLCGDVCKEVSEKVKLLTPVPGGVGLLTTVSLVDNIVKAYKLKKENPGKHKGTVKFYDTRRGIGRIVEDNGRSICVHFTGIKNGQRFKLLHYDADVIFDIIETERGMRAVNVVEVKRY